MCGPKCGRVECHCPREDYLGGEEDASGGDIGTQDGPCRTRRRKVFYDSTCVYFKIYVKGTFKSLTALLISFGNKLNKM